MKRVLVALLLVVSSASATSAMEIRSSITDSVQLTVEGAAVQTNRIGSSYSVSGSNVTAGTLGRLTGGSATAPPTVSAGAYTQTNAGQTFTFSETATIGDVPVTSQGSLSAGQFASPNLYGNSTTQSGGTAGTLAGTLSPTGIPTVTAGGAGTTAIGQRTVELTVFR